MKITINLLPNKQKSILRAKYVFRVILEQQILITVILILILLGLFSIHYILKIEKDSLLSANEKLIKQPEYVEILDLHKTFAQTNTQVQVITSLQEAHIGWNGVLTLLSNVIPVDISIGELKTEGDVVTLRGISQRVDALVDFQRSLSEAKIGEHNCFQDVTVPDQYLVKSEDANFVMTFKLNVNDCMKEKYE